MADKTTKYFEAVGRRKTSSARVRLYPSTNLSFEINGRKLEEYFLTDETRELLRGVFTDPNLSKFKITAKLSGGGAHSQAEAARHGIARALLLADPGLRQVLR